MSVIKTIRSAANKNPLGEPFTNSLFLKFGSRSAVDKALSRLVQEGVIERITRGVFVRPKINRFIGSVTPSVTQVVKIIAKSHGEVIQMHGAQAASRFKITTQIPTVPVYYTNGSSREISIGKLKVKLIHTSSIPSHKF